MTPLRPAPWIVIASLAAFPRILAAAAPMGPPPVTFDVQGDAKGWIFSEGREFPGAAGRLAWDGGQGHQAPGCLALHYSFKGGGNYVQAGCEWPAENDYRGVRLWLHKAGSNRITFRAVDSRGQAFQKSVEFAGGDWQQLEVGLSTWQSHWGGPNDRKVAWPMRQFGVLIENSGDAIEGVLRIDDVTWVVGEGGAAAASAEGVYDVLGDPGLGAGGGQGRVWGDGVWRYQFDGSGEAVLYGGFSLLASPVRMRLEVESDGSGHAVSVELGSHFQGFRREIGRLDRQGPQMLEAPLDDLSGWKHFGGENDGVRRLPLRLVALRLERRDGPARGEIRIKRLEIQTSYSPREAVILIPSVRQQGDGLEFSVLLRNVRAAPAKGKLVCEIRTLGERIGLETVDLELPGGSGGVSRSFPQAIEGRPFADATFRWIESGVEAAPANVGWAAVPETAPDPALNPSSAVGAGLYLYRWNGHPQAAENMRRVADLARRAGVKWSREEFGWASIEPREGEFNWAFYDQMVDIAREHGISVYGLLAYWSGWAKTYTDEGVEQYCRWAREMVRHYKGRIRHWEIWNEPNIFFWSGPRELYAKLLTKAYEAIKAEDPDAVVLGCSTAGIDRTFIENVMKWGGRFDDLTIHPYRGVLEDLPYLTELQEAKNLVGGRPVWITEIGFPTQLLTGYSERNQASLVARVYLLSLASGAIESVSWYDFRNDGVDPFYNEMNFGLVRHDLLPKPGYTTLAAIGRLLGRSRVVGRVEWQVSPSDGYAFRFSDGKVDTIALCSPKSGGIVSFRTPGEVEVFDAVGAAVKPVRTGETWSVTYEPGFPLYIRGRSPLEWSSVTPVWSLRLSAVSHGAGDRMRVEVSGDPGALRWELPHEWQAPRLLGAGVYEFEIPAGTPAGKYPVTAMAASGLRWPLIVVVRPALIRV